MHRLHRNVELCGDSDTCYCVASCSLQNSGLSITSFASYSDVWGKWDGQCCPYLRHRETEPRTVFLHCKWWAGTHFQGLCCFLSPHCLMVRKPFHQGFFRLLPETWLYPLNPVHLQLGHYFLFLLNQFRQTPGTRSSNQGLGDHLA